MAHRSRLSTILIDVPQDQTDSAAAFWSGALGVAARPVPDEPQFTSLPGVLPGLTLAIQSIDGTARYHLDFETDDVEAETARLIALGAEQIDQWLDCHILRIPGGQLVCVIPRHSDDETFDRLATRWD
ncbi:VOC family protein [Actinoplanes sp. M2I2]|uniref:VOC family protein n=1 Tax=Actinoplanes sp. M2I2 TaxID=1734444 RepID=UPI0020200D06|nr:VOC family protein [Actinoplanes sp. M2I2]